MSVIKHHFDTRKKMLIVVAVIFAVLIGYLGVNLFNPRTNDLIIAFEAESANDCQPDEKYSPDDKACLYQCASKAECDELLRLADTELDQWGDTYQESAETRVDEDSPYDGSQAGGAEEQLEASYAVQNERIALTSGKAQEDHQSIWNDIATWSPDVFTDQFIESFGVFRAEQNETFAYVHDDDSNGKWVIAVNAAAYTNSSDRERAATLIHELGHIVTLNNKQVQSVAEEACSGFFTGEGCAASTAYIAQFVERFWSTEMLKAVGGGAGEGSEGVYKPQDFVTEYAATNPGEDIAESFAFFILDPKNEAPQRKAEEKVSFFYRHSDLVSFRDEMRRGLVTDIVRAKKAQR